MYFVTGTDTGVGKTLVSCALAAGWAARGFRVGVMKPCETGCPPEAPADALALLRASGAAQSLAQTCPYRLRLPLSPEEAAKAEGVTLDLDEVAQSTQKLISQNDRVVIEGAGGLLVPLNSSTDTADFAARLGLPLVVVARAGLGTINHSRLTLEAAQNRGLRVRAVVLVQSRPERDPSYDSNPEALRRWGKVEIFGPIDYLQPLPKTAPDFAALAEGYLAPLLA
jgi:dethiobiotin synthetase